MILNCLINNTIAFFLELTISNVHDKDSTLSLCLSSKEDDEGSSKIHVATNEESDYTPSNCQAWSEKKKITAIFGAPGSGKSRTLRKQFELLDENKIIGYLPK